MKIEDIIKTKFINPQQKALINIRYTSNFLSNIQNDFMSDFGITMAQFNILRILRGAEIPLNVNSVKSRMIEVSPNITRIIDKLVVKKLIFRTTSNEDRREIFIEINNEGLELLKKIDQKNIETRFSPANLTDLESETLSALLDKIREGF